MVKLNIDNLLQIILFIAIALAGIGAVQFALGETTFTDPTLTAIIGLIPLIFSIVVVIILIKHQPR